MRQEFKINLKNQLYSVRQFIWLLIPVIIVIIFFEIQNHNLNSEAGIFTLDVFCALYLIMILPIHIQYLIENWNTRLIIDINSKKIKIIQGTKKSEFNMNEIYIERIIGHQDSWKSPFKYYGFIRIKTKNNEEFIITSLMANPFKFPLKIDKTKYSLPYIKKSLTNAELKNLILEKKESEERRIGIFINSFKNLSIKELNSMLENKKDLQIEAIIAAEKILKEKTNSI